MPLNFLLLLTKIHWFPFPTIVELFLHSTAAGRRPCLHPRRSPLCSLHFCLPYESPSRHWPLRPETLLRAWGPHQCLGPQKFIQTVYREVWKHQGFKTYIGNPQLIGDRHRGINTLAFPPLGRTTLSCVLYSVPESRKRIQTQVAYSSNFLSQWTFSPPVSFSPLSHLCFLGSAPKQTSCTQVSISVPAFRGTIQIRMDAKD